MRDPYEIRFSLSKANFEDQKPYLYEIFFTFWIDFYSKAKENDDIEHQAFLRNMDFVLPLCLKSLVLRCSHTLNRTDIVPTMVFDIHHMQLLEVLVSNIASSLVQHSTKRLEGSSGHLVFQAVSKSDFILDFFVGLLAIIHPSQVSYLISTYLQKLRYSENGDFLNARICRQLRLRAAERLASLPRFAALNFPFRYHRDDHRRTSHTLSWINQASSSQVDDNSPNPEVNSSSFVDEQLPKRHWLAETLLNDCFEICLQSCDVIVSGSQVVNTRPSSAMKKQSAMRQRIPLTEEQMLHHQSIAYHAITIAYELLLRKQATDLRFQSEEALSRIAGMCKYIMC